MRTLNVAEAVSMVSNGGVNSRRAESSAETSAAKASKSGVKSISKGDFNCGRDFPGIYTFSTFRGFARIRAEAFLTP